MDNNTLSALKIDDSAKIKELRSAGSIRRRLQDIGLIEGTDVKCVLKSPGGDPAAFLIRGTVIAIRREDMDNILVYS
ncbi:MAG: ferrous iron transport protein A [Clostridia bacterium]|nr:ferrous iron transport protein A [Clostridia bacterium]